MRHFRRPPSAIAGLAGRVTLPTAQRLLIPLTGFTHAPATAYRSALATAKLLSPVAAPAQLHLLPTETALK
jgi:hypothetical protein